MIIWLIVSMIPQSVFPANMQSVSLNLHSAVIFKCYTQNCHIDPKAGSF